MKLRPIRFSLLTLFVILTFAALIAFWFRPRQVHVDYTLEALANEHDLSTGESYLAAQVRVTNQSWNPIWYFAADTMPPNPSFVILEDVEDEWRIAGFNQLPRTWFKLRQGESFPLKVPLYSSTEAFKVVMDFSTEPDGSEAVERWSETFQLGPSSQ